MPLEPQSDLHWTAFLYVSGELTAEEESGFERLLAESQDAREAVAAAVELAGALAIVAEGRPRRSRRAWPGRPSTRRAFAGAALVAAAAGLVLAIVPTFRPARPDPSEVAAAWSGLRGDADAEWMAFASDDPEPGPAGPGDVPPVEVEAVEVGAAEPPGERALPSWLLSAASAPVADPPGPED